MKYSLTFDSGLTPSTTGCGGCLSVSMETVGLHEANRDDADLLQYVHLIYLPQVSTPGVDETSVEAN